MESSVIDFDQKLGVVYKLYNVIDNWYCVDSTMTPITDVINEMIISYYKDNTSLFFREMRKIGIENWRIKILDVKFVKSISELDAMETECIKKEELNRNISN
jgi:hypothetical protein